VLLRLLGADPGSEVEDSDTLPASGVAVVLEAAVRSSWIHWEWAYRYTSTRNVLSFGVSNDNIHAVLF
jgi:hypothetical protein